MVAFQIYIYVYKNNSLCDLVYDSTNFVHFICSFNSQNSLHRFYIEDADYHYLNKLL